MGELMILSCFIVLGKALFSIQWGKGILIFILYASVGATLMMLGIIGMLVVIIGNIFLFRWLDRKRIKEKMDDIDYEIED